MATRLLAITTVVIILMACTIVQTTALVMPTFPEMSAEICHAQIPLNDQRTKLTLLRRAQKVGYTANRTTFQFYLIIIFHFII